MTKRKKKNVVDKSTLEEMLASMQDEDARREIAPLIEVKNTEGAITLTNVHLYKELCNIKDLMVRLLKDVGDEMIDIDSKGKVSEKAQYKTYKSLLTQYLAYSKALGLLSPGTEDENSPISRFT